MLLYFESRCGVGCVQGSLLAGPEHYRRRRVFYFYTSFQEGGPDHVLEGISVDVYAGPKHFHFHMICPDIKGSRWVLCYFEIGFSRDGNDPFLSAKLGGVGDGGGSIEPDLCIVGEGEVVLFSLTCGECVEERPKFGAADPFDLPGGIGELSILYRYCRLALGGHYAFMEAVEHYLLLVCECEDGAVVTREGVVHWRDRCLGDHSFSGGGILAPDVGDGGDQENRDGGCCEAAEEGVFFM